MHTWTVITHGGGEGLVYAFNAVAAFFNGRNVGSSVGSYAATFVMVSGSFATAIMVYMMVIRQDIRVSFNWLLTSFLLMSCLMLPKSKVLVTDRITGLEVGVANVPFMLGAFAGISSQLGDVMAKRMDTLFSTTFATPSQHGAPKGGDMMNYTKHGVAMASQLVAKASRFTITDPDMAVNMREFVQQCVIYDVAKGKYSLKELLESNDVWKLLSDTASEARGFPYRSIQDKRVDTKILTCKKGVEEIEKSWDRAYQHAKKIYGSRFFPHSRNPANALAANLELSYAYLTNISAQASDILRQNMMVNALEDGLISFNQVTDASAAITGYAATRAQEQQKTAYALQGKMASLSLSVLKIVVEVMFYGIFPIIAVIAVLPGGFVVVKKYIIALFWIQSWAPLYSILNMLVNIYGRSKSMGAVTGATTSALSAATLPGLAEANEWVAAVAGYTMMSVPFLSYGLIHYGAGALSQLSTHFGSVTQSAASHAAEEATTGNYSLGNTNFDNHSMHNISGFKQDTNLSVATGRSTLQLEDGSMVSRNSDGSAVFNRPPAISNIGGNINWNESMASSYSQSADESHRVGVQSAMAAQNNISSALNQMQDFRESHGKGTSADTTFSQGESVLNQSSISKFLDKSEQFADENRISKEASHALLANAAIKIQGSYGAKVPLTNIGASISGEAGVSSNNTWTSSNSDLMSKAAIFSEKEGLSEILQKSMSEAKDMRFNTNESESSTYASSIASNLSKAENQMQSASTSFAKEDSYREAAQMVTQQGTGFNQDMSQKYVEWLSNQNSGGKPLGASGVHHVISDEGINRRYMQNFMESEGGQLREQFVNQAPINPSGMKEQYTQQIKEVSAFNNPTNDFKQASKTVLQDANKQEINSISLDMPQRVSQKLQGTEQVITSKKSNLQNENNQAIDKFPGDKK
jgi:conjugal transfer mating pair stabilization protein TraG